MEGNKKLCLPAEYERLGSCLLAILPWFWYSSILLHNMHNSPNSGFIWLSIVDVWPWGFIIVQDEDMESYSTSLAYPYFTGNLASKMSQILPVEYHMSCLNVVIKRHRTIRTGHFNHMCKVARVKSTNFPFRIMY